jgi:hypothetical protein
MRRKRGSSRGQVEQRALMRSSRLVAKDNAPVDVAFAAVFNFAKDPQRGDTYTKDDPSHIESWKNSCDRLAMNCRVLHDGAYSAEFAKLQSTAHTSFVSLPPVKEDGSYADPELKQLTTSDMRFMQLLKFLKTPDASNIEYVLLTDAHDVSFRKDPMTLMRAMDGAMDTNYIFGQEEWRPRIPLFGNTSNETAFSRMVSYWQSCFDEPMPKEFLAGRMLNCAILGGHKRVVMPFLERMRSVYLQVPVDRRWLMCDMLVYMRTAYEHYGDRLVTGYPFHAKFKNEDLQEEAAIYHKSRWSHP